MRLIDADDLDILGYLEKFPIYESDRVWNAAIKAVAEYVINRAPTIDRPTRSQFKRMAVQLGYEPVIHCRECGHYDPDTEFCEIHSHFITRHGEFCYPSESREWKMFSPDYFCGDGERKTDE